MCDMGRVQVGLRLEEELLKAIDVDRGDVPRNRYIERTLEEKLGGVAQSAEHPVVSRKVAGSSPAVPVGAGDHGGEPLGADCKSSPAARPAVRACKVCGTVVTSPSLVRCMQAGCPGKIVPEPA